MTKPVKGRFAPSPSGRMHPGNLISGLLAWLDVRSRGGVMVLRMEDLDPDRCREEYARQVADDLAWLGLDWDEGYPHPMPDGTPSRQSGRGEIYRAHLEQLDRQGLIYPCWCTRAQRLAAAAPHRGEDRGEGACPCRALTPREREERLARTGRLPAVRVAVPDEQVGFTDGNLGYYEENLARGGGDFPLRRSDGVHAYQLAVTVDDALMGITRVVRGSDLLASTPRQIWLHRQLGYEAPQYCHVPLLLAPDGRRLSKREGDMDMNALRKRFTPEQVVGRLACLAGLTETPAPVSAKELVCGFSWEKVQKKDVFVPPDWFG